jgi:hypothetical protein
MYDIVTTAALFFLLVPGLLVSLPPGGSALIVAAVHAAVFYALLRYASIFVPWWLVWLVVAGVVAMKMRASPSVV